MLEDGIRIELSAKLRDYLLAAEVEEDDLRHVALTGLARALYQRKVLSLGLAAELAEMGREEFVVDLSAHGTPLIDLPAEEAEKELAMIDGLLQRKKSQ